MGDSTLVAEQSRPEFLTPTEVAMILKVSSSTVYNMLRKGLLPHIRTGKGTTGSVRIPRSSVEAFLRGLQ